MQPPAATQPTPDPTISPASARSKIRRAVEDRIDRVADSDRAESLRAGLHDRLDEPNLDEDIAGRPIPEVIDEIFDDLCASLRHPNALPRHLRRDIEALRAQAARLPILFGHRTPPLTPPRSRIPPRAAPRPDLSRLSDADLDRIHTRR